MKIFIFILLLAIVAFSFAGAYKENKRSRAHRAKRTAEFWLFLFLGLIYAGGCIGVWFIETTKA
jgi:uncharacterized membrane protein YsdA (DUF1294 family)